MAKEPVQRSAVFNPFLWKFSAISCGTNSGVGLELRVTAFYFLTFPNRG